MGGEGDDTGGFKVDLLNLGLSGIFAQIYRPFFIAKSPQIPAKKILLLNTSIYWGCYRASAREAIEAFA